MEKPIKRVLKTIYIYIHTLQIILSIYLFINLISVYFMPLDHKWLGKIYLKMLWGKTDRKKK